MRFFGFRLGIAKARQPNERPPQKGGVLEALRHSPLVGPDLDLTREKPWDELFRNGPRASDDFMNDREQSPAEERESL
jgi:hypothetical protein